MGLMDTLRRGAGRAAFEADKLMRANRARGEIAAIEARIAEQHRQMGARLVELYEAGSTPVVEVEQRIKAVLQMRAEIALKHADLDAILAEHQPEDSGEHKGQP
jgi:hypothetical protein